jgi:hypothetical protein
VEEGGLWAQAVARADARGLRIAAREHFRLIDELQSGVLARLPFHNELENSTADLGTLRSRRNKDARSLRRCAMRAWLKSDRAMGTGW